MESNREIMFTTNTPSNFSTLLFKKSLDRFIKTVLQLPVEMYEIIMNAVRPQQEAVLTKKLKLEHPYLTGNFAPIDRELALTQCDFEGLIPECLAGGEYVRNGGNPLKNDDLGRDAHWFDGDGMLSGVLFRRTNDGGIQPEFVNAYVLTDVYLASRGSSVKTPLLPSITSLMNPLSSVFVILWHILRTICLVFLSHTPGWGYKIKRISVANTGILYFDNRALATCESGPPMRVLLPGLESVGWFDGTHAEGEYVDPIRNAEEKYGNDGLLGWMKEWTTAHPRIDPASGELISFHSSFLPPYIRYSVVSPETKKGERTEMVEKRRLFNAPVRGVSSAKMTHDFGVSLTHTIILDLPLSLDPLNMMKNKPIVAFDPTGVSRYAVFPRYNPEQVQWYEEEEACVIFHTANTWDGIDKSTGEVNSVKMLSCRLNSGVLAFSAGNLPAPPSAYALKNMPDVCQLYYHEFGLNSKTILQSFPVAAIPFEFPAIAPSRSMQFTQYVYGCSLYSGNFSAALGRAAKIDCLVKMDVKRIIKSSKSRQLNSKTPCDTRLISQILETNNNNDTIKVFRLPEGYYAQEMSFVPRNASATQAAEDDGYLITYVFNERNGLDPVTGYAKPDSRSELWVIDAKDMKKVVVKVVLPQRVPYGLHGTFFTEAQVEGQREVESLRQFVKI